MSSRLAVAFAPIYTGQGDEGKGRMAEQADIEAIWALGLMSGTSLDGVDAALLKTDGVVISAFGPGSERPYQNTEMRSVEAVMDAPHLYRPPSTDDRQVMLDQAQRDVVTVHAAAVMDLLASTEIVPDLIGFHGQTAAHDPEAGWTWQLGDGAVLARVLNRTVIWDFRSNDMVHGGEGAPLAPFFHWALARYVGATAPVAFVNIGGVANVTWVDPAALTPEADGALMAFDTGPGNALLNDWMRQQTGQPLDRDGAAAAMGAADRMVLRGSNVAQAYLDRTPPKSLDRNSFSALLDQLSTRSTVDGAATLTALTADCIADAQKHMPTPPARWLICGGGRKNPELMRCLGERLSAPVDGVEAVGLDGDLLEAQAFAYLAVRAQRELALSAPGTTGCDVPVSGGQVSQP